MAKAKVSNTEVGIVSPVVGYEGGDESKTVASQYTRLIPSRVVGSLTLPSTSLYIDDIGVEDREKADEEAEPELPGEVDKKKAPTLSDIELVSNTVVYDAAGNPSATVIFKVRNSSGELIKSVNARVQVI